MPDELDVSHTEALTNAQRDALLARLKTAWNNLPAQTQTDLKPLLNEAHEQLAVYAGGGKSPDPHLRPILRMKSYLTDDWDGHLQTLGQPINQAQDQPLAAAVKPLAIEISVGSDGAILGTGKYQELDLCWELVSGTVWLENLLHKHPFPKGTPAIQTIGNTVTIAMAGDFGTGNFGSGDSPSTKISKLIPKLKPDYTIHLGDVYYAGTTPEETANLLNFWPQGSLASFTLNSNHEMYSGAGPYFNLAVGGPVFNKLQSPYSFFALENDNWIIVGLDSAYYSNVLTLYMSGTLGSGNAQIKFLQDIAQRGKKVIVLTHHNGLPINGDPNGGSNNKPLQLYTDVMNAFAGQNPPAYWYYGHEHIAAVYPPINGTLCRCLGHAALPWGLSSDLQAAKTAGKVEWFETRSANDPDDTLRIYNGFVLLQLDGPNLTETFYDETGNVAWPAPPPPASAG